MFRLFIDTCVWFDLAKDYHQQPVLAALDEMVKRGDVSLLVPRTVLDEFARNRKRVLEEASRSVSSTLRRAREVVDQLGPPRQKRKIIDHLTNVDHRLHLGDVVTDSVERIDRLLAAGIVIQVTDAAKLRAIDRAVTGRAPFHRNKNSINDAILIELYRDLLQDSRFKGSRFGFVTHNVKDFSEPNGRHQNPHPDIAACFSRVKSRYFITLRDALRRVHPGWLADIVDGEEWAPEPRRATEISEAISELIDKVWYNRHKSREWLIEQGKITLVDEYDPKRHNTTIVREIWEGAKRGARRAEAKYGKENLGPWDDFEWGMLNGKLSALRWVFGDEWDMLDT
jgi:hypothetical protein